MAYQWSMWVKLGAMDVVEIAFLVLPVCGSWYVCTASAIQAVMWLVIVRKSGATLSALPVRSQNLR